MKFGTAARVGIVVIGRNEGVRLDRCLAALAGIAQHIVYVDSNSSDRSVEKARRAGVQVIELSHACRPTAARARNVGLSFIRAQSPSVDYVQFVDGDCELNRKWIPAAAEFMDATPRAAVAVGRVRERSPEASVYNRLCEREWNAPVGLASACGGIALMRVEPFETVGGFREDMIAGEEPELCVRLRAAGWEVWRLDEEMALHDAAMTRFSQWWRRSRRGGHAAAEGMALHGGVPERHGVRQTLRALAWGVALPGTALASALFSPWSFTLMAAYPLQVLRLALRDGWHRRTSWEAAVFTVLGKVPESIGVLDYAFGRITRRPQRLIEHK